jgi:hypothetical protein
MRRAFVTNEVLVHTPPVPTYPEDLLPELQRLLAALADLDARYETQRDHLDEWSGPEEVKQRLLADLEQKHRATREPYAMQVAALERQIAALPLCGLNRVLH